MQIFEGEKKLGEKCVVSREEIMYPGRPIMYPVVLYLQCKCVQY